ncbi:iron-containing alcohol dehydrogenase [Actinomycetospora sp. NBRC 106378]|uniref:iron-containing alcohol dehydrogenase n=1 Tax=Actinomycetospora sp. NBRC 106378 TaxID=3032208 RepID=UPI0024A28058|nr:iron-containing alcohol dehydrogenase [Actinomycetospora sp. NBRC 106378]GLZ55088.1 1,3-propanediol dehydrogenase [Actinomycetospora sp. NBRC 106378]
MVLVDSVTRAGESLVVRRRQTGSGARVEASLPRDGATTGRGHLQSAPEPPRLAKFHVPEIVFGTGSLSEAAHAAARLGARRPLLVTDDGLLAAGWPQQLCRHLHDAGMRPAVWSGVTPNPKDHEIAAGHECYRAERCDVLVAVGGGSVIDAAKGIALLAGNGGAITDFEGVDRMVNPIPPMVMVPATSGTGADVSQFCIVTDTVRNTKITILGRALVPDVSVVDPQLLTTMPDWLNAATGLDALTHGIEAYVSRAHNPLTDHHALQAISLVGSHLERTMDHPLEQESRVFMAQAALEAGLAFTNAILGAAHAMSHQVGGLLDLPHGVINGILLPHVVRFNAEPDPARFVPIAQALGFPDAIGGRWSEALAEDASEWAAVEVRRLADELGVPKGLAEIGVTEDDVEQLATMTMADACLSTNPREATREDIEALFRQAL